MNKTTQSLARLGRAVVGVSLLAVVAMPKAALAGEPAGFEYAFTVGQNSGAFGTKPRFNLGGTLSVPIFARDPLLGQTLLGEIFIGYAHTNDNGTFRAPAVTGLGLAAEPTPADKFQLTTFQVGAGVKYKLNFLPTLLGLIDIQPYVATGAGFYVFLSRTKGNDGDRAGGIAPISPDLQDRGVPAGQGDVLAGLMLGGGVDVILAKNLLVGIDVRENIIKRSGADFATYLAKVGFRF